MFQFIIGKQCQVKDFSFCVPTFFLKGLQKFTFHYSERNLWSKNFLNVPQTVPRSLSTIFAFNRDFALKIVLSKFFLKFS